MKNNRYTHYISKIKTPDSLLNKTIESIRNSGQEKEKAVPAPKNRFEFARRFCFAAAAVVFVATGCMLALHVSEEKSPFILTANAQELNTETYVKISDFTMTASSLDWCYENNGDVNTAACTTDDVTEVTLNGIFNMDVQCQAENAVSITYSTDNGYFLIDLSYDGVLDYTPYDYENDKNSVGVLSVDNMTPASSVTFDYKKQPESRLEFDISDKDAIDGTFPFCIVLSAHKEKVNIKAYSNKDGDIDLAALGSEVFDSDNKEYHGNFQIEAVASSYKYTTDITVTYADGSQEKQTLVHKYEIKDDTTCVSSKILKQ